MSKRQKHTEQYLVEAKSPLLMDVLKSEAPYLGIDGKHALKEGKSEGIKLDTGKPTTDLLPFDALLGVADVLEYGRRKYNARNWELGMAWGRLLGAMLRHTFAWAMGQEVDPESGKAHLAHASCCCLMLYALTLRKVGVDDRAKVSK